MRLGSSHFNGGGSSEPALCLLLAANGTWSARQHGGVLANGTLPSPFDSTRPHALSACARNATFAGSVDGAPLFALHVPAAGPGQAMAAGRVAVGCGYHAASFEDFAVRPANASLGRGPSVGAPGG